jgi:hypothetical protein
MYLVGAKVHLLDYKLERFGIIKSSLNGSGLNMGRKKINEIF